MWPFRIKALGPKPESPYERMRRESREAADARLGKIPEEHRWRYFVAESSCGSYIASTDGRGRLETGLENRLTRK